MRFNVVFNEQSNSFETEFKDMQIASSTSTDWSDITNKPFNSVDNHTLKVENNVLKVNTTNNAEQDNTLPITSAGTYVIVGNINTLLSLI